MIIKLNTINTSLGTRKLGDNLRDQILSSQEQVTFDFEGIDIISNSFADECFGKLVVEIGMDNFKKQVMFANANQFIKSILVKVINDRMKQCRELCHS